MVYVAHFVQNYLFSYLVRDLKITPIFEIDMDYWMDDVPWTLDLGHGALDVGPSMKVNGIGVFNLF